MRSGIINSNSPKEDIWGILTGVWNEYDTGGADNRWHVIKTPFFVHCEAVLKAGRHEIPFAPDSTKAVVWTSKDGHGAEIIRAGTTGFTLAENAFCEITIFGTTGGKDAH